jgi:hypothetical protein
MDEREELLKTLELSISTLNDDEIEQLIDYALDLKGQHTL